MAPSPSPRVARVYTYHERRAQRGSLRSLLPKFHASTFASDLREQTKTKKRPKGVGVGLGDFARGKCACLKKRKASECDCLKCTYVTHNLGILHEERKRWHRNVKQRVGGSACVCHIHPPAAEAPAAEAAAAWQESELETWRAAAEEGGEAAEIWVAMEDESVKARAVADAAAARVAKAVKYDEMTQSVDKLTAALMPCGKEANPDYSIIGEGEFHAYKKQCIFDDCRKKNMFSEFYSPDDACGFSSVFGSPCPTEANDEPFHWYWWEKQLYARQLPTCAP